MTDRDDESSFDSPWYQDDGTQTYTPERLDQEPRGPEEAEKWEVLYKLEDSPAAKLFGYCVLLVLIGVVMSGTPTTPVVSDDVPDVSAHVAEAGDQVDWTTVNVTDGAVVNQTAVLTVRSNTSTRRVSLDEVTVPATSTQTAAPERWGLADTPANRSCVAAWGQRSDRILDTYAAESPRGQVFMLTEENQTATQVAVNGVFLSHRLIGVGVAQPTPHPALAANYTSQLHARSMAVQQNQTGVWGCPDMPDAFNESAYSPPAS